MRTIRWAYQKPFQKLFTNKDKRNRVLLIPNLSAAVSRLFKGVFTSAGFQAIVLPLADGNAKGLGKKFSHNDICYPAQINIGECLHYLHENRMPQDKCALVLAKNCQDCRAGQYATIARKALDDAGYCDVPIVTTGKDTKTMHPGFKMNLFMKLKFLQGLAIVDALETMRLKIRPYELEPGYTNKVFNECMDELEKAVVSSKPCLSILKRAVDKFNAVAVDMQTIRTRVLVIGEILLNYHNTANNDIIDYLERNGLEVILPDMVSFFQKDIIAGFAALKTRQTRHRIVKYFSYSVEQMVFRSCIKSADRVLRMFNYYHPKSPIDAVVNHVDGIIERTHVAGEGWLIPAEIIEYARQGVKAFVIIQPFGCLPNQVTGKALIPFLKKQFRDIQIVSLDYDADISMANIENRLQMLIMAVKNLHKKREL